MPIRVKQQALRVALIYIGVAGCWIVFSDELLRWLVSNPNLWAALSIVKGWVFVLVTGLLLYLSVRRQLQRAEQEIQQRERAEAARSESTEKLRRNGELLRMVMEASTDGFWDWNPQRGVGELSPRYWEIIGYPAGSEVVNRDFFKRLVHPDDWQEVATALDDQLVKKLDAIQNEHRIITKNGAIKWVWGRGKVVERSAEGKPLRVVGTISDITERKQIEAELAKARTYYKTLLETSADGIHVLNQEGELLEANAAFYRMLGYSPENPPALKIMDWEAGNSQAQVKAKMTGLSHQPTVFETVHRRQDHQLIQVEITARRIKFAGQTLFYAASRDITIRKLAEEKLRESEEKFCKIFQNSPISLSLSTLSEGRYLDVNEEFLRMVQRTRDEVIGHSSMETGIWANAGQRRAVVDLIEKFGCVRNVELAIHSATGEIRHIVWSGEVFQFGRERCLLATSLDITDRKLAEEKMRESEERYRQLFDLESDTVILVDCETHQFVDVNQSAQRLYGYSREEFLRLTIEDISAEPEVTRNAIGSGQGFIPLRWHRKKTGEQFAVEITANIIAHQGRRTELATIRDITMRQHVMDMLSEATGQLLEAQRVAGLGSYVFDIPRGLWSGSEVLADILGLREPGFTQNTSEWLDLVHPEDREAVRRYLQEEVFAQRRPFDRTYRIVRVSDQQERWVHVLGKLAYDDHGRAIRLVGIVQDITERKRNEEQMNLQLSALSAAANSIVITDHLGCIKWVNPAFSKLTGYGAGEAIGKNPRVLNSGRHPHSFFATMWTTIITGNVWHGEVVNRHKDGHLYTEDMTITPVRGADGQVAHFIAIKQDVTERKQLEKRMQQAQKMEAIGTLAGGIAHDFNNILAAMFGYAYLLQQDTEGNAPAQDNIAEILKATSRAKDLVQQILTFSRQREQKPQVIQLDTVVKEAIRFLRASLPSHIRIEMNLAGDTPAVLADPTQIYQVAINLATNSLHAMEGRPGQLTIGLDGFVPDGRFIALHPDFQRQPYARLTMTDTGHGMDAKTLERIFEPFFTTKPVGKGTGLGLAVVHGIVEAHQGLILVNSEVGRGTTFQLYFPGQSSPVEEPTVPESKPPTGSGQKILLVDDEPALTTAIQRLLARLNYHVTTSNNPRDIVNWCRQNPAQFDLVITDLTMPDMTGLDVARQLQELQPGLPIVLASGFTADLNPETLKSAGIRELLPKPISWNTLAETVHRVLAHPGQANGSQTTAARNIHLTDGLN